MDEEFLNEILSDLLVKSVLLEKEIKTLRYPLIDINTAL